jgi:hypothetical protein
VTDNPLQWIKAVTGDVKVFRAMAVGWQTVLETLNATVMRFNKHHSTLTDDPNHEMKVIAAEQTVIASLRELRPGQQRRGRDRGEPGRQGEASPVEPQFPARQGTGRILRIPIRRSPSRQD